MKLLLIGNGFDLAHHLPTRYTDFLEFVKVIKKVIDLDENNRIIEWGKMDTRISNRIRKNMGNTKNNIFSRRKELRDIFINNMWIEYFIAITEQLEAEHKENWVDFEAEILKIIKSLEYSCDHTSNLSQANKDEAVIMEFCKINKVHSCKEILGSKEKIKKFTKDLQEDLLKLIYGFEMYLTEYVEEIEVEKRISDIEDLDIDYVLSFNYTHTYERIYAKNKNIKYEFIHGEADSSHTLQSNNMVLGIEEYLPDERKDKDLRFIEFKKYYQRILKGTGCRYVDWLDEISDLYIFGHSLDTSDGDLLRKLITHKNVSTHIFYHRRSEDDRSALAKIIVNLVKIIGQDELIERTGGEHRTIEFISQSI